MGYRSSVVLKTTTEGYILLKQLNDKIEKPENKPLYAMNINKTCDGYYKIYNDSIKWYEEFTNVQNFNKVLNEMIDNDIPFRFIELGEEIDDINITENWTDDMPDELANFTVITEIDDPDETSYEEIKIDE